MQTRIQPTSTTRQIPAAPITAIIRLYLGYAWLVAGWSKLTNPAGVWIGAKAGTVSTNPVLLLLATLIVLAWRVAATGGSTAGRCRSSAYPEALVRFSGRV